MVQQASEISLSSGKVVVYDNFGTTTQYRVTFEGANI